MKRSVGMVTALLLVLCWLVADPASAAPPVRRAAQDEIRGAAAAGAPLPVVSGRARTLVIPVYWRSPDSITPDELGRRVLGDVDAWYELSSYGRAGLEGDVVPQWLPIEGADDGGDCWQVGADEIQRQAKAAALQVGYDASTYRHTIVYFPRDGCDDDLPSAWALGLGTDVWLDGFSDVGNVAHELGHNYGLPHSLRAVCSGPQSGQPVTLGSRADCDLTWNLLDLMGATGSPWSWSAPVKDRLGWLEGRKVVIRPGSTVTVKPIEEPSDADGAYLDTPSGRRYWVEYRQRIAMDNDLPVSATQGVLINLVDDDWSDGDPVLLDMHPETTDEPFDSRLGEGESWTSPEGYTFRVSDLSRSGAKVTVTAPLPGAPTGLAVQADPAHHAATLTWAPPASDGGLPVTGYRVGVTCLDVGSPGACPAVRSTLLPAGARSFVVDRLPDGSTSRLDVRAVTDAGTGPAASTRVVQPPAVPGRPRIGHASSGSRSDGVVSVTGRWRRPARGGPVEGYRVTVTDVRTGRRTTVAVGPGETRRKVTGLKRNHRYVVTVLADNVSGPGRVSAHSNRVTAR